MAAKYCLNCGYKNEYSGGQPKKCGKCKTEFQAMAKDILSLNRLSINPKDLEKKPEVEKIEEEEGDFDTLMGSERPEPMTPSEIEQIFLVGSTRGFNLRDFMQGELDKVAEASKQAKSKPKTSKAAKGNRKKSK